MNVVPICKGSNGKAFGSESFGADITGVDLANLTGDSFEAIYRAWLTFGVLRFKGQTLNNDSLQTFSQRFGPLEQISRREDERGAKGTVGQSLCDAHLEYQGRRETYRWTG